ncbi:NUDIX domain-containing protein [Microbaculum marinum]|uniref:NUDIX domain-containing protein n=1 Tax=Microbaculum marinum TaxID=1764581 RepID=A0AAW9RTL7_9HYPH
MRRLIRKLVFRPWWRLSRGLTLGVRGVVAGEQGVLLVRHSYVSGWHLPGGGVERGETMLAALGRELREEGNVVLQGPPRLHGVFSNHTYFPGDHVAVFVVDEWRQDGPTSRNSEILEAAFFPLSELPEGATPATRRRLAEIFDGAETSEHW